LAPEESGADTHKKEKDYGSKNEESRHEEIEGEGSFICDNFIKGKHTNRSLLNLIHGSRGCGVIRKRNWRAGVVVCFD
jgi:hypothetical protein